MNSNVFSGVEWVFLDMGSVIVDEVEGDIARYNDVRSAMSKAGVDASFEEVRDAFEDAYTDMVDNPFMTVLEVFGLNEEQKAFVCETAPWRKDLEVLMPGADDFLKSLKSRYKLGIIANQSPGSEKRLTGWGVRHFFSFVLASAEEGVSKPDPIIFERALEKAGCAPEEAVMIGDRIDNDVRPAKRMGMKTIRFVYGVTRFQEPKDELDVADLTAYSLEDIAAALQ